MLFALNRRPRSLALNVFERALGMASATGSGTRTGSGPVVGIGLSVFMALWARVLTGVKGGNPAQIPVRHCSSGVFFGSDRLKVVNSNARRIPAKVVELEPILEWSEKVVPETSMCCSVFLRECEQSIAAFGHCSSPHPALVAGINFIEESLKPSTLFHKEHLISLRSD